MSEADRGDITFRAEGKRVENVGKFGIHTWNLKAFEEFEKFVRDALSEAAEIASREYDCEVYFPIEWNFGEIRPTVGTALRLQIR